MPATNLRIPGPTRLPDEILGECSRQMINHRGADFGRLLIEITDGAREFFGTSGDVFLLGSSGTGAMEASVVNFLSPGDRVLAIVGGVFADRTRALAEAFGLQVEVLKVELGETVDPEEVKTRLDSGQYRGVFLTQNETSTGVTNDVKGVGEAIGSRDLLFVVDGVSSVGAIPLEMDAWRVDVAFTASQKALMAPPGAALLAVTERAWRFAREAACPRFYFDLRSISDALDQGQYPWTPPLPICFALRAAMERLASAGLASVFDRHRQYGEFVRERIVAGGLELFASRASASNTVTAVRFPDGADSAAFMARAQSEHDTIFGSGEGELRGRIFRIGHMGLIDFQPLADAVDVAARLLK
ncbi:MAG: alanine--glyoxylate aminotransferase family protein [Chloroflexi bacterium]|nr:alanine--glyoxylate aminotransferase family protein [Chloroflexota bacterium]